MSIEEEIAATPTPRRFKIVFVFLVGMIVIIGGLGIVIALQFSGNATLGNQEQSAKVSACRLAVASDYDEARDEFLLALGDSAAVTKAQADLAKLYYPNGPGTTKVTRAELSKQKCGT